MNRRRLTPQPRKVMTLRLMVKKMVGRRRPRLLHRHYLGTKGSKMRMSQVPGVDQKHQKRQKQEEGQQVKEGGAHQNPPNQPQAQNHPQAQAPNLDLQGLQGLLVHLERQVKAARMVKTARMVQTVQMVKTVKLAHQASLGRMAKT